MKLKHQGIERRRLHFCATAAEQTYTGAEPLSMHRMTHASVERCTRVQMVTVAIATSVLHCVHAFGSALGLLTRR